MRILVTGGAGFIGSHIVYTYVKAGHEVAILDNFSGQNSYALFDAKVYEVDVCNRESVREVLESFRPDVLNHHAAMVDVVACEKNPDGVREVNVEGTRILLEEGIRAGIKKFIFASSGGAVYGECPEPATEERMLHPCGDYGRSKRDAEASIIAMRNVIPFVILRYANVYGPRGGLGVIPSFEKAMRENQPLTIYGDGKQVRDFIHVLDVARVNVLALDHEGLFNIGTGKSISIDDIARAVGGEASLRQHLASREGEVRESRLDVSHAEEILGFKATSQLIARG